MYLCLKLFAVFYIFCSFLQLRKKRRKTENMEDKSYSLLIISNFYCFPRHPMTFSSNLFIRVHCFTAVSQIRFFFAFLIVKNFPVPAEVHYILPRSSSFLVDPSSFQPSTTFNFTLQQISVHIFNGFLMPK